MSGRAAHAAAALVCWLLAVLLPAHLQGWGRAVRQEVAAAPDAGAALRFALDSLCGLAPAAIAFHLLQPLRLLAGESAPAGGTATMGLFDDMLGRPRVVAIACATAATGLGIVYMTLADAPLRYPLVNAGALAVGLVLLAVVSRVVRAHSRRAGAATMMMAAAVLATALLGNSVDGASRWVQAGPLFLQPSLMVLPFMVVAFAQARDWVSTLGIAIVAAALAIQPDRAMAAVLVAGLAVLASMRPDRWALSALAAAVAGFAVTMVRADRLPAVPYVDQILYTAFDVHLLAGVAVLGGSALLLVPAVLGRGDGGRAVSWVFGAVWLVAILAAALGNYPTPLVGYGGSAVVGYLLSAAVLPRAMRAEAHVASVANEHEGSSHESHRYEPATLPA